MDFRDNTICTSCSTGYALRKLRVRTSLGPGGSVLPLATVENPMTFNKIDPSPTLAEIHVTSQIKCETFYEKIRVAEKWMDRWTLKSLLL